MLNCTKSGLPPSVGTGPHTGLLPSHIPYFFLDFFCLYSIRDIKHRSNPLNEISVLFSDNCCLSLHPRTVSLNDLPNSTPHRLTASPAQLSHIALNMSRADIRLDGKVALITGAGRGLGAIVAKTFAERGADVVINYATSAKPAMAVVAEIEQLGRKAIAVQGSVEKKADIENVFEKAMAHFGKIDIVVNNAGMEAFAKPDEVTEELWEKVFNINTRAQFFVGVQALKYLGSKFS